MIANQPTRYRISPCCEGDLLTFYTKKLVFMKSFVRTIHIQPPIISALNFLLVKRFLVKLKNWFLTKQINLKTCLFFSFLSAAVFLFPNFANAWGNHSTATYRALENLPEISSVDLVEAQSLETFIKSQEANIAKLIHKQENWAQEHLKYYPKLPSNLKFTAGNFRSDLQRRQAFIAALRLAGDTKFALYLQADPKNPNIIDAPPINPDLVSNLALQKNTFANSYLGIKPGQRVSALSVIATATDEPDLGFDIHLWEDSPSSWGKIYGFGDQPFSNTQGFNSSQGPFHSAFYYETRLVYLANPKLTETYPLLRIYQFSSLAELAFTTGHDYWGWRFLGNALHYLQDLTQPYNASITPGETSAYLAGLQLLDSIGMPQRKNDHLVRISNRHLMLERYQSQMLQKMPNKRFDSIAEVALKNTLLEDRLPKWNIWYAKNVVAKEAYHFSEKLADTLEQTLPEKFLTDPYFDFSQLKPDFDLMTLVALSGTDKQLELEGSIARLMEQFGIHSRNMVKTVLAQSLPNSTTNINPNIEINPPSNGGLGLVPKSLKRDHFKLNAN
jgi:hypothetical protein